MQKMFFLVMLCICGGCGVEDQAWQDHGAMVSRQPIVGGDVVDVNKYAWLVSLRYGGRHFCTGSLIGSSLVVTAGHCHVGGSLEKWSVHIRDESFAVAKLERHPDYNPHILGAGDVMAVHLDGVAYTTPIGIGTGEIPPDLVAAGFGRLGTGLDAPTMPHDVALTRQKCEEWYSMDIPGDNVCYGGNGLGACNGDSGGPLWDSSTRLLYAITSWGSVPCATPGASVFVALDGYANWLGLRAGGKDSAASD